MAAVSGDVHQGLFTLPAPISMTGNAHEHIHDPGPYFYHMSSPANVLDSAARFYVPSSELDSYLADHSWQQASHQLAFPMLATETGPSGTGGAGNAGDPGDPRGTDATLSNTFDYPPYGEDQQREMHAGEFPSSFGQSYVVPESNEKQAPYVFDWNAQGGEAAELNLASMFPHTGQRGKTTPPVETESGAFTPSSLTSTSSAGQYSSMYAGIANIDYHLPTTGGNEAHIAPSNSAAGAASAAKKGKAKQKPRPGGHPGGKGKSKRLSPAIKSSSSGDSSVTGAGPSSSHESHSSGRIVIPPKAKNDEKRRGKSKSHNLVESQYRERLTEQFDMLRNALPQSSERFQTSASGTASGEETRAAASVEERRTSKAEVLEMARNHIRELEQRRDDLVRQKVALESTSQRLRQIYSRQSLGQGQTGALQPSFNDEEQDGEGEEEEEFEEEEIK
ncbi:hypothetical protein SEPCBS57363_003166 [Sporothrix epigloea]|uniref:BHLH domain-containing protein n=1 Tax=Sporothrix epigloea TaxID=1892477 RepID=A0ABP0DJY9_9PEZI